MAPRTLTPEQAELLEELLAAHKKYEQEKKRLRAEMWTQLKIRFRNAQLYESRLINEGLRLGIPKAVIARKMGFSTWQAVEDTARIEDNTKTEA